MAFSATVTKNAEIGDYKVNIKNKASSHRIASRQLEKNYKIPAGKYSFKIGNDSIEVQFNGGTLDSFASKIKSDSKDKLKATIANDTSKTQVLILDSSILGEGKYITFENDKTKELFKELGFYEEVNNFDKNISLNKNSITSQNGKDEPTIIEDRIILSTNQNFKINLPEAISYREGLVMEIDMRVDEFSLSDKQKTIEPTGPDFSREGEITIFDIRIEGESSIVDIPQYKKKEEEKIEIINDNHFIEIATDRRNIVIDELDVVQNEKTLSFNMNELLSENESVKSVIIKNNNTLKKLYASNLRFYDKDAQIGMKFKNELSTPSDSILLFDGLAIKRDTNSINDLIMGVTLNIYDKTSKEESLKIDRDYNKIVSKIDEFLAEYNQMIDMLNSETKMEAIEYREEDKEKIGRLARDYSIKSLISKLRVIMMNPYQTQFGQELSNLSQIGISTNESGQGFDATKLKGIIEINEDKFIEMMEKYPTGIKELFGRDSDNDMIIDTGIAFETESLLKAYTTRDVGYFDTKSKGLDKKIENQDKSISNYKDVLDKEEKDLKNKFYKMEKAAQELEDNRKRFDNINNSSK